MHQREVEYLLDELDARMTKRARQTVSFTPDIGQELLSLCQRDDDYFNRFLAVSYSSSQ